MYRWLLAASISVLTIAPNAVAQNATWKIDPAHTTAQFSARHMMISNVKGEFQKVNGTVHFDGKSPSKAEIEATIDADSIDTREPHRDQHLKSPDFLDAVKYPTISFKSKRIETSNDGNIKMIGDLTLHGITKEVVLDVKDLTPEIKDPHGNIRVGASASTRINRKDFGINFNGLLDNGGAVVGDVVPVTIDVEFVKQNSTASTGDGKASPTKAVPGRAL